MIKKKIKSEHVIEFLINNPNFFIENSYVLDKLFFPLDKNQSEQPDTKVVEFKDWIIENLKNKQKNIIDNAHYNFLTQKKIHNSVIEILKLFNMDDFVMYLTNSLPKVFNLDVINIVVSDQKISKELNFIWKDKSVINKIYGKEGQLIMDAVENESAIFAGINKNIYSNAIFSLNNKIFDSESLLVFGSNNKHFIDNKAYDLILFFSNVVQEKLLKLTNEL